MKEILLASAYSLLFALCMTFLLWCRIRRPAKPLFLVQCLLAIALFAQHILSPDDLGFLPDDSLGDGILNAFVCVFFFIASVSGGWMQLYNLADRGCSLRILIDILESEKDAVSIDYIAQAYSQGKGIAWMYQKRVDDMKALGFIEQNGDMIKLSLKGKTWARRFDALRKFYNFPDDAEFHNLKS